jgi:hypothetical protein
MSDGNGRPREWHRVLDAEPALARARAHEGPSMVEVVADPELV